MQEAAAGGLVHSRYFPPGTIGSAGSLSFGLQFSEKEQAFREMLAQVEQAYGL